MKPPRVEKFLGSPLNTANHMRENTFALGIDGGGTKTVALLGTASEDSSVQTLGRGLSPSSNINAVGWERMALHLRQAIDAAWAESGCTYEKADTAVFALAGAGRKEIRNRVTEWALREEIADRVEVIHDGEAALLAGTPEGQGVALIAGTGSVAYAHNLDLQTQIAGGWGYWFGDEGSAFWLGQQALRAVTLAVDGRGPETALTSAILAELTVSDPRRMITALNAVSDPRQAIAELTRTVFATAETGDAVASEIVDTGAKHLVALVRSAAEKSGFQNSFPLALAGGVLCGSEYYRNKLRSYLAESDIDPQEIQLVPEPALGALKLACT